MICENCGSNNVEEKKIEGFLVDECQVCGHLHGTSEVIEKINLLREAQEKGIDPIIYPIYTKLENIASFQPTFASAGYPQEKVPPYISFHISEGKHKELEQLTEILIESNKKTKVHWIIEATYQRKLVFILKPNFHHDPYQISAEQISLAQKDLQVIYEHLDEKF